MSRVEVLLKLGILVAIVGVSLAADDNPTDYNTLWPDDYAARAKAIVRAARHTGHADTLILGDSITERAHLPRLCGGSVANGGIGGAGVEDILRHADPIIAATTPVKVVLAIGINDAGRDDDRDPEEFAEPYAKLIERVRRTGAEVYAGTITPVARTGVIAAWYDPQLIIAFNSAIRQVAAAHQAKVVDFYGALVAKDGALPQYDTLQGDGVHLSDAGYLPWLQALTAVCK